MSYYVQLSADIKGNFGSGVTQQSIIDSLKHDGVSNKTGIEDLDVQIMGHSVLFDGAYTMLLGADKADRNRLATDLIESFGNKVDEIGLRVPKPNEWLACVTLVDSDKKTAPGFQVVALVGKIGLQKAKVAWTVEDKPPQLWTTHVEPDSKGPPSSSKMLRDVKALTGCGWW